MIQKESLLVPCDKSGIWLVKTIHTYTKLARLLNVNSFGKCSVRITNTGNISQKKKKKKIFIRQGRI